MYEINNNDSNFIIFLKTELNKLEKDYGKDYIDTVFDIILKLNNNIYNINYNDILNKISRLINNYPVTPIDLNNEYNTCIYINKDENNKWYYNRAYKIIVDTVYNLIDNKEQKNYLINVFILQEEE
jgi:hypothetical protein